MSLTDRRNRIAKLGVLYDLAPNPSIAATIETMLDESLERYAQSLYARQNRKGRKK